jgi:hypothetical protein
MRANQTSWFIFSMSADWKNFSTTWQKKGFALSQNQLVKASMVWRLSQHNPRMLPRFPEDGIFSFIMLIFDHPAL